MAYRLGVDVGGTFTDLFLVSDENGGAQYRVKTPSTPADPSEGVLVGVQRICDEAGIDVGRAAQHPARHDRRDERGARVEGRARRPDHDDGLQADPAPRALADARAARGLDHHDQARSARARSRTRARRSSGWTRAARRVVPVDEAAGRGDRPRPRRVGCRVAHGRLDQLVRQRRARAADRRDRRAALPGLPGDALARTCSRSSASTSAR